MSLPCYENATRMLRESYENNLETLLRLFITQSQVFNTPTHKEALRNSTRKTKDEIGVNSESLKGHEEVMKEELRTIYRKLRNASGTKKAQQ